MKRISSLDLQYLPAVVEVPMGVILQLLQLLHFVQHLMHFKLGHEELKATVSVRLSKKKKKKARSNTLVTFMDTMTFLSFSTISISFADNRRATVIIVIFILWFIYNTVDQWLPTVFLKIYLFLHDYVLQNM